MGKRKALFLVPLAALLLAYADWKDWSGFAIMPLACVACCVVAMATEKYSIPATALVTVSLIGCDALTRYYETAPNSLHTAWTLGDLSYSVILFSVVGWIGGRLVRGKHVVSAGKMELDPVRPPQMFVASPAFARRRMPRGSI